MKKTQIDIIIAVTLLFVEGHKSFSEDSVQQAENIQSPQLRKKSPNYARKLISPKRYGSSWDIQKNIKLERYERT